MRRAWIRLRGYALPAAIYAAALACGEALGFHMVVQWYYYQLLDRSDLLQAPLHSLYLLHGQPPVLNLVLAAALRLSALLGCEPETLLEGAFVLIGLFTSCLLYRVVTVLTGSRGLAAAALAVTLFDPGTWFFQNLFFYPYLLHSLFVVLAFLASKILLDGDERLLPALALVLGLLSNTQALFHPVFAGTVFVWIVAARYVRAGRRPSRGPIWPVAAGLVLLTLLTLWPLKNLTLFGRFTWSTWSGYNLSKATSVHDDELNRYLRQGFVSGSVRREIAAFQREHALRDVGPIADVRKSDGSLNWNHYLFVKVDPRLRRAALQWRRKNPSRWLANALLFYCAWTRATYTHPYSGAIRGPGGDVATRHPAVYTRLARWHRTLVFYDLRPILKSLAPGRLPSVLQTTSLPMTVFGWIALPFMAIASIVLAVVHRRRRRGEAALLVTLWFCVGWVLVVPCLSDGIEGNRMRFAVSGLLAILAVKLLQDLYGIYRGRRRRT